MIFLYPEGEPPPPPKYIHRPSYDEVRQRELEISRWDKNHLDIQREWESHKILVADFYRTKSRITTVRGILTIMSCICAFNSLYPLAIGFFLSALFANWVLMRHGTIPAFESPTEPPRPAPIAIKPFSTEENQYLLRSEDASDFSGFCQCPGCGFHDLHDVSVSQDYPGKAMRGCRSCFRMWIQN